MPEAILFDLDNTLMDGSLFPRAIRQTCEYAAKRYGLSHSALFEANEKTLRAMPSIGSWELGEVSGAEFSKQIWRGALAAINENDETMLTDLCVQQHRFAIATYRPFSDVRACLAALSHLFVGIGVITNGASDTQREKLDAMDLSPHLDPIVISGEVGITKPNCQIFDVALDALGVNPKEVWMVGDQLQTDILGANEAGIGSIWLNRNGVKNQSSIRPDHEISSLRDLTNLAGWG